MTVTPWVLALTTWFNANKRQMPWRDHPDPYFVWISEAMLQQTQVHTVIPYFNRFIHRFPTVYDLANADLQDVLKLWEGLGYYSRARNLHKAAQQVVTTLGGDMPCTYDSLQQLPGLGPYCAAAVASIAFEQPVPVVDGNVLRVFARFWGSFDDISKSKTRLQLFNQLIPFVTESTPSVFNQAMMELGALVCKPTQPKCLECPLKPDCVAYQTNQTASLPVKAKKAPTPHFVIGVGIVIKEGLILVAKRKASGMLGGLWEFPGGKQRPNELIEQTVCREIFEETGVQVKVQHQLCVVKHAYTHFKITMHAFICTYLSGTPLPLESDAIEWVTTQTLSNLPFPTANRKIIDQLQLVG